MTDLKRCDWNTTNPLYLDYHDHEWGVPLHDENKLFEFLVLEGAQAGLSWETILVKRARYRVVFDGFDPNIVASYDEKKILQLLHDAGIIRNRLKINAAILNARALLRVQAEFGSFDSYLWRFVEGKPLQNAWHTIADVPAQTELSKTLSKDLTSRGFSFVGPTICYAFMQAVGMVNDHIVDCFRYRQLNPNV